MLFPDLIPQELKDGAVWCPSGRGGNKSPYKPSGEKGVDYDHPESSFTTFDEAYKLYQKGGYDGVAMLVSDGWFVVDLDHVAQDGKLTVEAQRIIKSIDSYTEQSQGGDGVHIIGKIPRGYNFDRSKYHENHGEKECYVATGNKVITITGNREPLGNENVELRPVQVMDFLREFMTKPPVPDPTPAADMIPVSDDFIVDHLNRPGTWTGRLWAGDLRDYNDDWSRADLGLINAILKYSDDAEQIEKVFRRSGLVRPKDDDKRSGTTYLKATIEYARSTYSGPRYDPNYKSAPMDWDDPIQYDGHPTTEAGGGENVNNQETTKEEEAVTTPATNKEAPPEVTPPKAKVTYRPRDFSDAGAADVFIRIFKNKLMFVDSLGPHFKRGHRWIANVHADVSAARWMSEKMLDEALDQYVAASAALTEAEVAIALDASEENKKRLTAAQDAKSDASSYVGFAEKMRSGNHLKNMIALALPEMTVEAAALDKDPMALCCPGGIYDLTTGKIRDERPDDYCTKCTTVDPGDDGMEMWLEHINTVMCGDESLAGYFQIFIGSCLIGKVFEEKLGILHNESQDGASNGANGKSTTMNAVADVLGSYAGSVNIDLFTTGGNLNRGANLAELVGKRMITTSELEEGRRMSIATLKRICSTDPVVVERKYMRPETVTPTWHILMLTNHLPRVGSTDNGSWRRLSVIPFNAIFNHSEAIPNFGAELVRKCGSAILAWAAEGATLFIRNGCRLPEPPDVVTESTNSYQARENWIRIFIDECCIVDSNATVRSSELYAAYREWAAHTGDFIRRRAEFNDALADVGLKNTHAKNIPTWHGLKLSDDTPAWSTAAY